MSVQRHDGTLGQRGKQEILTIPESIELCKYIVGEGIVSGGAIDTRRKVSSLATPETRLSDASSDVCLHFCAALARRTLLVIAVSYGTISIELLLSYFCVVHFVGVAHRC